MPIARFTKAEITRAVEATKACGLVVTGVEIAPDGTIRINCPVEKLKESEQSRGPKQW